MTFLVSVSSHRRTNSRLLQPHMKPFDSSGAHADVLPLLPFVDESSASRAVGPLASAPASCTRRFVAVCLISVLVTALVCTAVIRSPSPPVFHVASPQLLPTTERDRLFLQPNTALWPNVCDSSDGPDSGRNHTAAYRYQLAAAMIIKNEAAWIYECLEYHLEVGVEHFFIVDDNSDDDTLAALAQYIEDGLVTLLPMPELMALSANSELQLGADGYVPRQKAALAAAVEWGRSPATRTEWILVMDTDERYVAHHTPCLRSFMSSFSLDTGVVYWHWQMFGTSGIERLADDEPMIGALVRKAAFRHGDTGHFKPAVRPVAVDFWQNTHKPIMVPNPIQSALGDSAWKRRFTDGRHARGSFDELVTISHAQLNHYFTRDADYHRRFKIPERQAIAHDSVEMHDRLQQQLNETEDLSAVPLAPAVMRRIHQRRRRYTVRRP